MAPELEAAGATLHVVPMRRITTSGSLWYWLAYVAGWPPAVFRLVRLARRIDAQVIHSNSLHSWYGWAVAAVRRRPHVWHAREIVMQSSAALRFERFACRHFAARVIAVSAAVAAQLDGGNIVVEYDEADPEEFCPERAGAFRDRIGVADDVPLVGAAGRTDTWKGFEVLLDAVPAMQAACPGLEVVIAGAPVLGKEDYAARLAARSAVMPGIHWLGPRDDIAELIADLDVLVLPSTEPEPFGLVVVEALASGVPVVATAAGGPLEILRECSDRVGRLIPPGDAAALATATVQLLPPGPSGAAERRRRPVLRTPFAGSMAKVFDELIGA
jgi:glycosyltransferase involved in cell wall biosynthesis